METAYRGYNRGLSAQFMIYNCIKPDTTLRPAAQVTIHASQMINRTGTFLNYAWGDDGSQPSSQEYDQDEASSLYSNANQQEVYIDEETEALNEKGRDVLKDLYIINQKFRDEVINFVGDKTGLGNVKSLDNRYKYNTPNKLGMEFLGMFAFSKDHARSLIEFKASYK